MEAADKHHLWEERLSDEPDRRMENKFVRV
jgi:hypothetical protein